KAANAEAKLRAAIAEKPELVKQVGDAYESVEKAYAKFKPHYHRYFFLERWTKGEMGNDAMFLVRGADERTLPDGKRLDEHRDSALPDLEQKLGSSAPVYPAREKLALAYWLGKVREELGADDPTVKALLGKETPEQVAARLVDGSKLGDPAERMKLWKGGR